MGIKDFKICFITDLLYMAFFGFDFSGQSFKDSTIVNYVSRVLITSKLTILES